MTKQRTTVSLDEEVMEAVQDSDDELSARVNEWARYEYLHARPPHDADMVEQDLAVLRRHVDMLETALDQARHRVAELEAIRDGLERDEPVEADDRHDDLTIEDVEEWWDRQVGVPDPDNPAVRTKADRLGMSPEALADHLQNGSASRYEDLFGAA